MGNLPRTCIPMHIDHLDYGNHLNLQAPIMRLSHKRGGTFPATKKVHFIKCV